MKSSTWKILAIIFMILFVVETLLVVWLMMLGMQAIENEKECSINICDGEQYDSFFYDDYDGICYCYKDNEIIYQEFIG